MNPKSAGHTSGCCGAGESSEAELVKQAKTNNEAFGRLYEIHYRTILTYAFRRTLDMPIAEEITANTFLNALKAMPRYNHRAPFLAWLYRIASNELRMHWRQARRHSPTKEAERWRRWLGQVEFASPEIQDEEETAAAVRRYARVVRHLNELPERYQAVLSLRYIEELSYEEIASILGKRMGTIKSLIYRGLKRLRKRLEESDATLS